MSKKICSLNNHVDILGRSFPESFIYAMDLYNKVKIRSESELEAITQKFNMLKTTLTNINIVTKSGKQAKDLTLKLIEIQTQITKITSIKQHRHDKKKEIKEIKSERGRILWRLENIESTICCPCIFTREGNKKNDLKKIHTIFEELTSYQRTTKTLKEKLVTLEQIKNKSNFEYKKTLMDTEEINRILDNNKFKEFIKYYEEKLKLQVKKKYTDNANDEKATKKLTDYAYSDIDKLIDRLNQEIN